MNYIIIGLGNFGITLAEKLTSMGHDVFGVDSRMEVVEEYKNKITTTMCLNITDANSLSALPLDDTDVVVVALAANIGDSLLVCAFLKQANVKHVVARASNIVHKTVLETMGIDEIITPETYAADIWALSSELQQIKGAYLISDTHQILEIEIPTLLEGQSLQQVNIEENFQLKLICVKREATRDNFLKGKTTFYEVVTTDDAFRFVAKDRIVVYGTNLNMDQLKKALYK